ncbi:MAG: DUF4340 domain-containing protein, partial [Planctomycetales bacterium]
MRQFGELGKTSAFVAVAAIFAVFTWPWYFGWGVDPTAVKEAKSDLGDYFFSFDPEKVTKLEIVGYSEDLNEVTKLNVEKVTDKASPHNGLWLLQRALSQYPTDAKDKLGEATATILYLRKGSMVANQSRDFAAYGVIDVDGDVKKGARGVGSKVKISENDEVIAEIIIGKEDPQDDTLRYVRNAKESRVYRAKIDLDKLSTKFEDWIETDLLQLNRLDLATVVFDN